MRNFSVTGLFVLAVLAPATALPQGTAKSGVLDEMTVTSQRREQNVQEIPVSVTAFNGEALALQNINDAAGYLALVPNVSFDDANQQGGARGINIAIRGIGNNNTDESAFIQSIGVYLDEFSVASVANATINPQLYDVERIEVLRGPQGTFFGRNSVGGALNITTKKPTDQLEGEVTVGAQGWDTTGTQFDVGGVINVPVSDQFAMRFVGYYEDNSGIVENIVPDGGDSGYEYSMVRGGFRFEPSDRITVDAMLMYTDEQQGIDEAVPAGVWDTDSVATFFLNDPGGNSVQTPLDDGQGFWPNNRDKVAHSAIGQKTDVESLVGVFKVGWSIGDINLHWITGLIDTERQKIFDNDLVPEDMVRRYEQTEAQSWSTELRFDWQMDSVDWIGGFLYSEDTVDQERLNTAGAASEGGAGVYLYETTAVDTAVSLTSSPAGCDSTMAPCGGPTIVDFFAVGAFPPLFVGIQNNTPDGMLPLCLGCGQRNFDLESWAIFTDVSWRVTDALELIVGGRYTEDKTSPIFTGYGLTRTPRIPDPTDPSGMTPLSWGNSETFTDFSPRLAANWQATDDQLAYVSISKGYKAGGFSLGFNSAVGAPNMGIVNEKFDEEELWNYEIGYKSEWLDNRLRFNAALFYLDWKDFQYETFFFTVPGDPTSNINLTKNIKDSEAYGAEFEFAMAVTEQFVLNAALGYLDTEITSDDTATLSGNLTVDLKGQPLPRSPEWTWNASADYFIPMGSNEAFVRLEWIYRDESFSTIEDVTYLQTSNAPILDGGGNVVAVVPDRSDGFPFVAPDYHVFNLRAGFNLGEQWRFLVWIENLADEDYFTGAGDNFGLSGFRLKPHPRVYGGNVTFSFGGG